MATLGIEGPFEQKQPLAPGELAWVQLGERDGYRGCAVAVTAEGVNSSAPAPSNVGRCRHGTGHTLGRRFRNTHPLRRRGLALAAALVGLLPMATALAAPAEAATTIHYTYSDPSSTQVLPCGAVWTYTGEHRGIIVKPDDAGGFLRIVQQDYYPGTITYNGRTYIANDHQTDTTSLNSDGVSIGSLSGQGLFTHLPRIGVVVSDTGHLVFDENSGQTIKASNHVIPLDEPFDFGAAVCAALTGQ